MKKILFFAAICAAVMASCGEGTGSKLASERDSLQKIVNQKDDEINEMMGQLNEIQQGFSLVNEAEGRVNMLAQNAEGNSAATNIEENLKFIQETLAANRQKISELEKKLNNSSINASKLRETITNLTKQLEAKATEIAELREELAKKDIQIATLNADVSILTTENSIVKQQRDSSRELAKSQEEELNRAWYVIGTAKELEKHGIRSQGNLFKKGKLTEETYDKSYFTQIDIRNVLVIPLSAKSAELASKHPEGSYNMLKDTKGEYTLQITNADKFWSITRYLVVKVK